MIVKGIVKKSGLKKRWSYQEKTSSSSRGSRPHWVGFETSPTAHGWLIITSLITQRHMVAFLKDNLHWWPFGELPANNIRFVSLDGWMAGRVDYWGGWIEEFELTTLNEHSQKFRFSPAD